MKVESSLLQASYGGNDPIIHGEDEDPGERIIE